MPFAKIEDAIAAIGRGEIVVVVDDEDRENEGDLIMAAEYADARDDGVLRPPHVRRDLRHRSPASGPASSTSPDGRRRTPRASAPRSRHRRRPRTARPPASPPPTAPPPSRRSSTRRPAPTTSPAPATSSRCAREGGVLKRAGHTEAAVDLARLAGCYPAGVLCEIVNDDGTMARLPELERFAERARPAAHLDRRPHPLPPPAREAGAPGRRGPHPDPVRRLHLPTCSSRCSTATSTSRSCGARSPAPTTCSSGCTPSASPATCSARCAATAAPQLDAAMAHDRRGGHGRRRVPPGPRGPGHRPRPQDARLRAAGRRAATPSRPTSSSGFPPTAASTASARRSSSTSASPRCGS